MSRPLGLLSGSGSTAVDSERPDPVQQRPVSIRTRYHRLVVRISSDRDLKYLLSGESIEPCLELSPDSDIQNTFFLRVIL